MFLFFSVRCGRRTTPPLARRSARLPAPQLRSRLMLRAAVLVVFAASLGTPAAPHAEAAKPKAALNLPKHPPGGPWINRPRFRLPPERDERARERPRKPS